MFIDEPTTEYYPSPAGKKVRMRPGEELCEKNLKPSFKSRRTNVGVFACIAKGSRTRLILVRKRTEMERRGPLDKLGLNASQFASKMHKSHVIPFIRSLCDNPNHIYLAANGATWHHGPENKKLQDDCGYHQLPWLLNSPDLNLIENLWLLLKRNLKKRFSKLDHRPHSASEFFLAAQEEWDVIDQASVDDFIDSMPHQIQAVIDADGGHTK